MALLTYDQADPGWTHASSVEQVHNAGGRFGAWSADVLFMTLGYFAYLFPLLLMVKTVQVYRQHKLPRDWSGWLFAWRLLGLIFLVLSGAALIDIHFIADRLMPASAGGALGASLGQLALAELNVQGSTLLFIAFFLFGLTVYRSVVVQGAGCHRQDHSGSA